jgi:hypothetical protein
MISDWLKRKLTVEEAEKEYSTVIDRAGNAVPFGFCNKEWKDLLSEMQLGDELWEFRSPQESWKGLCGRAGICLVRDRQVIAWLVTEMN